ncbi:MAG: hypothetical protein IJF84_14645 [Thermoguttaceae bacterium]|nr:hypothetical protein [Thermoguttaceae bacterium]
MESTSLITAQQLFWGHNGFQYGFLSGEDSPYSSEVERLCTSVGTPDGILPEPFLLSMPFEDKLFWTLCCNGDPDKSNRSTLFFHILIVNRADVERLGINAFDAMESNCFSNSVDSNLTVEIHVDSRYAPKNAASNHRVIDNRVIISNRPEPDAVFQLVQLRINEIPWATYSYRFMDQMEVSALSDKAPAPDFTSQKSPDSVNVKKDNTESAPSPIMKKLFIGSLILNVVLLLGYFVLPSASPTNSDAMLKELQNSDAMLKELQSKAPKTLLTDEQWNEFKGNFLGDNPNKEKVDIIESYIHFVNDNFSQERND